MGSNAPKPPMKPMVLELGVGTYLAGVDLSCNPVLSELASATQG